MPKSPQDQRKSMINFMIQVIKKRPHEWREKNEFFAIFQVETGASNYRTRDYFSNAKIYLKMDTGLIVEKMEMDVEYFRFVPFEVQSKISTSRINFLEKELVEEKERLAKMQSQQEKTDSATANQILAPIETQAPTQTQ